MLNLSSEEVGVCDRWVSVSLVRAWCVAAALLVVLPHALQASPDLKGIACRSVHLGYAGVPDAVVFYNEVEVSQSADGTYFCVCGFSRGYYGIQELADGRRLLIFSVWDPGNQNDPNQVAEEQRVRLLHRHPDVRVGRFGNEGTGGQSFLDFEWKNNTVYRLMVAAKRRGNRTEYAAFFFHPDTEKWLHLVTFDTLTPDTALRGYYAFVEDFRRNRISATKTRTARFPNGWVMTADNKWSPIVQSRFTGDGNPVVNINSGVRDGAFYLTTGGAISNDDVKLGEMMKLPETAARMAPADAEQAVRVWLSSTDAAAD